MGQNDSPDVRDAAIEILQGVGEELRGAGPTYVDKREAIVALDQVGVVAIVGAGRDPGDTGSKNRHDEHLQVEGRDDGWDKRWAWTASGGR